VKFHKENGGSGSTLPLVASFRGPSSRGLRQRVVPKVEQSIRAHLVHRPGHAEALEQVRPEPLTWTTTTEPGGLLAGERLAREQGGNQLRDGAWHGLPPRDSGSAWGKRKRRQASAKVWPTARVHEARAAAECIVGGSG
jgi:hypothetical protein